jgi:hypothetical protein
MVSLKDRRNSGKYTPTATAPPKELKKNNLEISVEYDDWQDHRDSFRDNYKDFKQIKKVKKPSHCERCIKRDKMNKKQELLLKRRAVKNKR